MEDVSKKLEVMLSKLQKMNINMLGLWFPSLDKEEILTILRESNKFKFDGDYVRIKTYEEIYEEELKQKIESIENEDVLDRPKPKQKVKVEEQSKPQPVSKPEPTVNSEENIKRDVKAAKKIDFAKEILAEEQEIDIKKVNGAEMEYEDILRIVKEYNDSVEERLEKFDGTSFEAKTKAIVDFYETKYALEKEEVDDLTLGVVLYSLTNKKRGIESGYVAISSRLDEKIVEYMSENYSDEVVFFCPINGCTQEFEFDLNEFFIKDTEKIFAKHLKKCVVAEEQDFKIKKVEIVTGQ